MQQVWNLTGPQYLLKTWEMSETTLQLGPPLFHLAGLAVGNGLTDPALQVGSASRATDCRVLEVHHGRNGLLSCRVLLHLVPEAFMCSTSSEASCGSVLYWL